MIKPSFDIVPEHTNSPDWQQSILLIEVAKHFLGCVWYSQQHQKLLGLRHYNLEDVGDITVLDLMNDILENDAALNAPVGKVVMVYNYAESSLVPETRFQAEMNRPLLELIYGDAEKGLVLSEKIDLLDVYNVYRIPVEIHQLFQHKFSSSGYWHYYTLQLSVFDVEKDSPSDMVRLRLIFYADKFIIGAFRNGELLIFQTFAFQTPEDVSYYLLTLLDAHDTSPEDVILKISGLIDEDSILYAELLKYFQHLVWDGLPETIDPGGILKEYPRHYFSPLVRMALCV